MSLSCWFGVCVTNAIQHGPLNCIFQPLCRWIQMWREHFLYILLVLPSRAVTDFTAGRWEALTGLWLIRSYIHFFFLLICHLRLCFHALVSQKSVNTICLNVFCTSCSVFWCKIAVVDWHWVLSSHTATSPSLFAKILKLLRNLQDASNKMLK